jgi:hypothetical protein
MANQSNMIEVLVEPSTPPPALPSARHVKPDIPYKSGWKFSLHEHIPPAPLGLPYQSCRKTVPARVLLEKSMRDVVLHYPPLEGGGHTGVTVDFVIDKVIAVKDGRGAQLVGGWATLPQGRTYVAAKIFDSLYYEDKVSSIKTGVCVLDNHNSFDYTRVADREYTCEAAIYKEYNPRFGGKEMAKFYGTYTIHVNVQGSEIRRPVRVILMEYLKFTNLKTIKVTDYTEALRKRVMASVLNTWAAFDHHGIQFNKGIFWSSRVLVCSPISETTKPLRVVYIGFTSACVRRLAHLPVPADYMTEHKYPTMFWPKSDLQKLKVVPELNQWADAFWGQEPTVKREGQEAFEKEVERVKELTTTHEQTMPCQGCKTNVTISDTLEQVAGMRCKALYDFQDTKGERQLKRGEVVILMQKGGCGKRNILIAARY